MKKKIMQKMTKIKGKRKANKWFTLMKGMVEVTSAMVNKRTEEVIDGRKKSKLSIRMKVKKEDAKVLLTELSRVCGVIFWLGWKRTERRIFIRKRNQEKWF